MLSYQAGKRGAARKAAKAESESIFYAHPLLTRSIVDAA